MTSRFLTAIALLCALVAPAYAQKTKAQLTSEIGANYPDNGVGFITPADLRTTTLDMLNSIMPNAPVVSGNLACYDGTTGLLKDCGSSPTTAPLTIGTTPVNGGSTTNIIFDNAGILGEYTISGSGSVCMTTSCAMTTPALGIPSAVTLTNGTGLPISTGVSGLGSGIATALAASPQGSGSVVLATSPSLTTPVLGVAAATSVNKVAITAPASSATLTLANGTTLTETTSTSVGQGQYLGTAANDNATAGNIGEYIESVIVSGSATSLTSTQPKTVTSINLSIGDWEVDASADFLPTGSTSITYLNASIGTTTNSQDATPGRFTTQGPGTAFVPGVNAQTIVIPNYRFSLSTPTTIFLVEQSVFSASTLGGYGLLRARRAR